MPADLDAYRQALIDLYLRLPDTPRRLSRFDLRLAHQVWERQVRLPVVEMAFLLASARRAARPAGALPLGPIRSLHYFSCPSSKNCSPRPFVTALPISPTCATQSPYAPHLVVLLPPLPESYPAVPTGLCSNFYVFTCAPT